MASNAAHSSDADLHLFGYGSRADVVGLCSDNLLNLGRSQLRTLFALPLLIPHRST